MTIITRMFFYGYVVCSDKGDKGGTMAVFVALSTEATEERVIRKKKR